jgi:hypothetical protein
MAVCKKGSREGAPHVTQPDDSNCYGWRLSQLSLFAHNAVPLAARNCRGVLAFHCSSCQLVKAISTFCTLLPERFARNVKDQIDGTHSQVASKFTAEMPRTLHVRETMLESYAFRQ